MLKQRLLATSFALLVAGVIDARADQTIVFLRHGEKPSSGLGQLTCQGLNRALALPDVLAAKFGKADYVYAPNPNMKISDSGGSFYYVRPIATIEPTAIRQSRSINTKYGYTEVAGLQTLLINSAKADTTIYVAWEHAQLVKAVQNIMNAYGNRVTVPAWTTGDYDSLYVVTVDYSSGTPRAQFARDREGLNGLPTTCP